MENEFNAVVPTPATDAAAQTTPVENGTTTTPEVVTVSLADYQRLQADVATLKQLNKVAQSDKDKKKAQITKSLARRIQAVNELAASEGWEAAEVKERHKAIADEHAVQMLELEGIEDEIPSPAVAPFTAPPPLVGVATSDEAKNALKAVLADFGLTEKEVSLDPFLVRVNSDAEVSAIDKKFRQAVKVALESKQGQVERTAQDLLDEAEAARVAENVDKFGGLGGNTNRGAPGDSGRRNSKDLNADVGAAWARKYGPTVPR